MKLPHLPPICFAQKVLTSKETISKVYCEFPTIPSLPMFIEAAAQSSAAFKRDQETIVGFLVTCKKVQLHTTPTTSTCIIDIKECFNTLIFGEYQFQAFSLENILLATGFVTISYPKSSQDSS